MEKKKKINNEIIFNVKELLISNGMLSYGEKKTFEKFLVQISEGIEFEEAVGILLRGLSNLMIKEGDNTGISPEGEKIFIKAHAEYEIASPQATGGVALHPKLTNREWVFMLIGLVLFIVILFVIKKPD